MAVKTFQEYTCTLQIFATSIYNSTISKTRNSYGTMILTLKFYAHILQTTSVPQSWLDKGILQLNLLKPDVKFIET